METKGAKPVEGCYTSLISAYCKVRCCAARNVRYDYETPIIFASRAVVLVAALDWIGLDWTREGGCAKLRHHRSFNPSTFFRPHPVTNIP